MHILCQKFYHVGKSYIEDQLRMKQDKNMPDACFRDGLAPGFSVSDLMPESRQTFDANVFSEVCGVGTSFEQDLMADNEAWSFGDPHILGILGDGIFGMSGR
ncbi:hypothetical protein BGZ60DRAFT_404986 [Tricladium varicosporioides]|nr:hypothetical protein BGZ60DRAFT_404986 [Hymenoscyphus varicosporioides]